MHRSFLALLILCVLYPYVFATSIDNGQQLAQKVYDRDDGQTSYAETQMVLLDKRGNERVRIMLVASKHYGNVNKRYMRFMAPAAIKDTAFLAWENVGRPDDQFLYLPALGRVRRISSGQKDQSFANSDFTYEDLEKRKVDLDTHRLLRTEPYENYHCWVLESTPKEADDSQYGRVLSWIDQRTFVPVKVEFYDKRERFAKMLLVHRLEQVDGIWTAMESEMRDVQKKQSTLLKIVTVRYNRNIPDAIFTEHYLQNPG